MKLRLVWRTDTGHRAWQSPNSGLPAAYRRILDLAASPVSVAAIVAQLSDYPGKQVQDWVDELETLCFIHASRIDPQADLLAA